MTVTITRRSVIAGLGMGVGLAACGGSRQQGSFGIAVLGIGHLSLGQAIPAIDASRVCRLAGLVSSSREKLEDTGRRYGVPASAWYGYDDFDAIEADEGIDAIYIAVPNALHHEYTTRALRAGKHVLCEKPLGVSVAECEDLLEVAREAGRRVAVNYRVLLDPYHLGAMEMVTEPNFGGLQLVKSGIGFPIEDDWRLKRSLAGGGALLEQGVYGVSSARNLFRAEPVEVFGHDTTVNRSRFVDLEESAYWTMVFEGGGVAQCAASYTVPMNRLWAGGGSGFYEIDKAYSFSRLSARHAGGRVRHWGHDQFEAVFDNFAEAITTGRPLGRLDGTEGLADLKVIEAVYRSMAAGGGKQALSG